MCRHESSIEPPPDSSDFEQQVTIPLCRALGGGSAARNRPSLHPWSGYQNRCGSARDSPEPRDGFTMPRWQGGCKGSWVRGSEKGSGPRHRRCSRCTRTQERPIPIRTVLVLGRTTWVGPKVIGLWCGWLKGDGFSMTRLMNNVKTALLMGGLMGLFLAVGSMYGQQGMIVALVFGGLMNIGAWFFSDKIAIATMGGREVLPDSGGVQG